MCVDFLLHEHGVTDVFSAGTKVAFTISMERHRKNGLSNKIHIASSRKEVLYQEGTRSWVRAHKSK